MRTGVVIIGGALVAIACAHTKSASTPSPAGSVAAAGRPEGQGGPPRRRPPANPYQQDTVRRAMVDSLLRTIAGRETEPAGQVFRNVKLLKDMPAGEFLRTMEDQYGRGLGWTCSNCHVPGKFDDDVKKNKRIARQMQAMQNYINDRALSRVKELDAEYDKATCAMCHHGSNEPKGAMDALPALPRSRN